MIAEKSRAFTKFQEWRGLIENETSKKVQKIRSSSGGELISQALHHFYSQRGIAHQFSKPNSQVLQDKAIGQAANRVFSHKVWVYLLAEKFQAFTKF